MSLSNIDYTASGTAIAMDVTSLGIDGYRESAGVTNAVNKYLNVSVSGRTQVGVVTVAGLLKVYAFASNDGGIVYSGGLIGTDETITWGTTPSTSSIEGYKNIFLIGRVAVALDDDDNDIEWGPFALETPFQGIVPEDWGIVMKNQTDIALHATGTNNLLQYSGTKIESSA